MKERWRTKKVPERVCSKKPVKECGEVECRPRCFQRIVVRPRMVSRGGRHFLGTVVKNATKNQFLRCFLHFCHYLGLKNAFP